MPFPVLAALGGAAAGQMLGGGLSQFFHKNPADAASGYLDQIMPMLKQYLEPYINRGNAAYDVFAPQYSKMGANPAEFLSGLQAKYQESPWEKIKRNEAMQAAASTANAGGYRGNIGDIINQGRLSERLQGAGMQDWLAQVLGIQGAGLNGLQNTYNQGAEASRSLAGDWANVLGTKSQLAYNGANQRNQNLTNLFSMIGSLGGAGLGAWGGGMGGGTTRTPTTQPLKVGDQFMTPSNQFGQDYGSYRI
jgi:hypothetical protein